MKEDELQIKKEKLKEKFAWQLSISLNNLIMLNITFVNDHYVLLLLTICYHKIYEQKSLAFSNPFFSP